MVVKRLVNAGHLASSRCANKQGEVMRYFVLWLFGAPFSVMVWLWALAIF